jgi:hypothetical protein
MANRRKTKDGQEPGTIIAQHPKSEKVYCSGVEEGIHWAEAAGFDATAAYSRFGYDDIQAQVWRDREVDGPATRWNLVFTSNFRPPVPYADGGLPEASFTTRKYEVTIFWMGWLDGVKEVAARYELEPLMAAANGDRVLVMDSPRPGECPVCWVERNLGVKVAIRDEEDQAMAK